MEGLQLHTSGPMSVDQHEQIGILQGCFIKQNEKFEKSQELKGK
jgi:hypothetical protein